MAAPPRQMFRVTQTATSAQVFTGFVYVNESDYMALLQHSGFGKEDMRDATANGLRVTLCGAGGNVYTARMASTTKPGEVSLNMLQRKQLVVTLDQPISVVPFKRPESRFVLSAISFTVGDLRKSKAPQPMPVDCKELGDQLVQTFAHQVMRVGQSIAHNYNGIFLELNITALSTSHSAASDDNTGSSKTLFNSALEPQSGLFLSSTDVAFKKNAAANIKLTGNKVHKSVNQMVGVNFEELGIGGLNKEFSTIFRRAFASRTYSPGMIEKLGTQHVRGMMLYGPPGCGKTLIARQISKVLQGGGESEDVREPKVVNGPEILSKFVGEAEKNIRELFAEAEAEQEATGMDSELHVIIFDEIDAICKQRGSSSGGTGVGDSVVNQLLSKIDGVNALHNILVIGMTNRLDMIDNALLRPGRFEVQIEIGLPDEEGRLQILAIHTNRMRKNGLLADDVSIDYLAKETKNFSGAEIEGLVRAAASHALQRQVDGGNLAKPLAEEELRVEASDFEMGLREVIPAFGMKEDELSLCYRNGIVDYGDSFKRVTQAFLRLATQVRESERTPLLSMLLAGPNGCGKTALVAKVASESGFPFVKMISADAFIGMHESQKCSRIADIFNDAYKSPLSMIIIDDIERLIEYVSIGTRFSNTVLQALLVLINKPPPRAGRRLMVVGTTAVPELLQELGLTQVFNVTVTVPQLETTEQVEKVVTEMMLSRMDELEAEEDEDEEGGAQGSDDAAVAAVASGGTRALPAALAQEVSAIAMDCPKPIGIKKLLMFLEMARQDDGPIALTHERFMECLLLTSL